MLPHKRPFDNILLPRHYGVALPIIRGIAQKKVFFHIHITTKGD